MWSDFNNSFTFALTYKLRKRQKQTLPPHLISVATNLVYFQNVCRQRHSCQWSMDGVNDALFNAAPNVQQAMAQNAAVTLNDVNRAEKIVKQKVNPLFENTSKFITLKLS